MDIKKQTYNCIDLTSMCNVAIIGDCSSGKTRLVKALLNEEYFIDLDLRTNVVNSHFVSIFNDEWIPLNFKETEVITSKNTFTSDQKYNEFSSDILPFHLYDISGESNYEHLHKHFLSFLNISATIIVIDGRQSLDNIVSSFKKWKEIGNSVVTCVVISYMNNIDVSLINLINTYFLNLSNNSFQFYFLDFSDSQSVYSINCLKMIKSQVKTILNKLFYSINSDTPIAVINDTILYKKFLIVFNFTYTMTAVNEDFFVKIIRFLYDPVKSYNDELRKYSKLLILLQRYYETDAENLILDLDSDQLFDAQLLKVQNIMSQFESNTNTEYLLLCLEYSQLMESIMFLKSSTFKMIVNARKNTNLCTMLKQFIVNGESIVNYFKSECLENDDEFSIHPFFKFYCELCWNKNDLVTQYAPKILTELINLFPPSYNYPLIKSRVFII